MIKLDPGPATPLSRRDFLLGTATLFTGAYLMSTSTGCSPAAHPVQGYPIDSSVKTTAQRTILPTAPNPGAGLAKSELCRVSEYGTYGYGKHTYGEGIPAEARRDLMPDGLAAPTRLRRMLNFFAFTDIHITDKEAPNQLINIQQWDTAHGAGNTSIYSPVMLYSTQVLDAAIQTINALHTQVPFDFGISLGDACNSAQYNETRWYIDVLDGGIIHPSSGAHAGAGTIDYQKPFKAAGLNRAIPWYQVLGNHDHFYMGSVPVDANPALGLRQSYVASTVLASGNLLIANPANFPCLFDTSRLVSPAGESHYMGVLDGSTPYGTILGAGPVTSFATPPTVPADPDRRYLPRTEWMKEFSHTITAPVGHGFNLVDPSMGPGFACYSFLPNPAWPIKVIVLDDTQMDQDGSKDIHGHGYLDATRWNWLKAELAAGQASDQLMLIAAHIPLAVSNIGTELEWWNPALDPDATVTGVPLSEVVATLQATPNLLLWIAGHRHLNTVKAFPAAAGPQHGFWQVETSSLRDFPQQFRTFEVHLNSDYSISIVVTNVDPAVGEGTPAATSRSYAIATQQIARTNLTPNAPNVATYGTLPVATMDPTRPQSGLPDPSIRYGMVAGAPYPSYNAELFKYLDPQSSMVAALKALVH